MSNLLSSLLRVSDVYCAETGIGRQRLSTLMLGAGHRLDTIAAGGDLKTRTCERAMQWLSDNWPADAAWPKGVDRPLSASRAEGAPAGPRKDADGRSALRAAPGTPEAAE